MIGAIKVRDHEVDIVSAKVLCSAKLYGECDLTERYRALSRENNPKLCLIGFEIVLA
jgi:hypothetical protein